MPIPIPGLLGETIRRSTISIRSQAGRHGGTGSGIALKDDLVITNAHVVHGAHIEVESWDGRVLPATVQRIDRGRDLALLSAKGLRADAAQLGDSGTARPGTPVLAVGNPLGFTGAMSSGIIYSSYVVNGYRWLCADIRLAPGNSGGPLANFDGQVVGINTMVITGGLALAVPSRSVQAFLTTGQSRQPIGVTLRPIAGGIVILEVRPGTPADHASLRPGDILVAVNAKPLDLVEDLQIAANQSENVIVDFRRGGDPHLRRVVLNVPRRSAARAA